MISSLTNIDIDLFTWFIIIPPVMLISSIPISVGGWGVREGILILSLIELKISHIEALKISIIYAVALVIAGSIGGIFWVFNNQKK